MDIMRIKITVYPNGLCLKSKNLKERVQTVEKFKTRSKITILLFIIIFYILYCFNNMPYYTKHVFKSFHLYSKQFMVRICTIMILIMYVQRCTLLHEIPRQFSRRHLQFSTGRINAQRVTVNGEKYITYIIYAMQILI